MTRWLTRLLSWREEPGEQTAREAFLADIDANWKPTTRADQLLSMWSHLEHARQRLFGGAPSLAPIAFAGPPTAVGAAIITFAPRPHNPAYLSPTPAIFDLLLTIGILGVVVQALTSPRTVRLRRMAVTAALPLTIGALGGAITYRFELRQDIFVDAAQWTAAVGMAALLLAAVLRRPNLRQHLVHGGLIITGLACAGFFIGDLAWTLSYAADGDRACAYGCLFSGAGTGFISFAFLRSARNLTVQVN